MEHYHKCEWCGKDVECYDPDHCDSDYVTCCDECYKVSDGPDRTDPGYWLDNF